MGTRIICIAIALFAVVTLGAGIATAQADKPLPGWFKWGNTSVTHHGHPCIVVWSSKAKSKAELCADGSVQYPF